ncbi:hypothetical protein XELAEV_18017209mg [Xenopus laevis]|uniref:Protein kinase domain-containing protein n=1 Tax=Xenopus laevis TaxID=8355 RepID=A0A974HSI3_XENLA|nr:hypothetical protein XELAEV_18017209mg [Xenopus laevis]
MLASLKDRRSKVAVKIIKKNPGSISNIQTEANILKMTSGGPYLCHGYAAFQTQRHVFLIMEYVSGGSLRDQLESHSPLDMTRVEFQSAEIVCGLQFLHNNSIVHRSVYVCYFTPLLVLNYCVFIFITGVQIQKKSEQPSSSR